MQWPIEKKIMASAGVALVLLVANGLISYLATRRVVDQERLVSHTHQVLSELEATMSAMKDAETGERGYIITGEERYLEPYQASVDQIKNRLERLRELTAENPDHQARIPILERKITDRLNSLKSGIDLKRSAGAEGPSRQILSGSGKRLMDDLRQYIDEMESNENQLLTKRAEEAKVSARDAYLTLWFANSIACGLVLLVAYILIRDITARKRAEEALRQQREWFRVTISSIGDGVIATDINSQVTFLNPVAQSLTGWKQEEAEHQPLQNVFKIVNEDTRKAVDNPAMLAMREGIIVGLANHTVLVAKDGTEVSIDDSGAPIRNSEGKILGAVLIFRDMTERRRAEEERAELLRSERRAREQSEAASHAKDEFVAMISHEIRAPLNAILGWAQLLRLGKLDPIETACGLETIERNASAQAQLIEDLLDISRVITGKLSLNVRPVDPSQIVQAAIDSIRPAADAKSIQLQVQLEPGRSLVSGDAGRLQQIIWNLLSNAVKFTPKHGRIEVSVERINSHVQVRVSDSGAGITPEFLPYVFDRFKQASTTSERKHGGLGLGLAIVRHLVEMHGGTVLAESPGEGQGATFTVTLPVRVVGDELSEFERVKPADGAVVPFADTIRLDGLRIMIVDDEAETRYLLMKMLTQRGAEVKTCASAGEALEAIEHWHPSLLISDIGMPDEDGYALIEELRAREPERGGDIPAVALTAYARGEDRMRALTAGFQMHVTKPVEALELIIVVASLAGRKGKGRFSSAG